MQIFFANFFFNSDFAADHQAEYNSFCKDLPNYMHLIYSLAVNDYIEEDTVNFYLIGGKYLVPSSEILRSVTERKKENIPITFPTNSQAKNSTNLMKIHKDYWTQDEDGDWSPDGQNRTHFDNLVGKTVNSRTKSIRSNIDYSFFLNNLERGEFGLW